MERLLAQDPTHTKRTLENLTIIATPNQEAAIFVSTARFQGAVTTQELLAEEQAKVDDAKAAGDVTKIWRLEQTTVAGKPAIILEVERGANGRGYDVKMLSGELVIDISCVVQTLDTFAAYEPDFNHLFETLSITQ